MTTVTRVVTTGLALAVAFILGGCASTRQAADATDHAVVCPQCETIWVRDSSGPVTRAGVQRLSYKKETTCPMCDKMAKAYFEGDKVVLHDCPDCKVTPKVYETRTPLISKPSRAAP